MKELMGLVCANYDSDSFGPLTNGRTAASLPFAGRYRLIDFPLSNMVNSGIRTVGVITPYMYRSLLDHIGSGEPWELGRKTGGLFVLPGTIYGQRSVGAKVMMRDLQNNRPFFTRGVEQCVLTTASMVMNIDYKSVATYHAHSGADITLVYKKDYRTPGGMGKKLVINEFGRVTDIVPAGEESCPAFLESLVINTELLLKIMTWYSAMGYMDLMEVIKENLRQLTVNAYEFSGYAGAVEDLMSYYNANMDLLSRTRLNELLSPERPISTKTQDYPPTRYGRQGKTVNSLVGSGCIIEGTVENCIISRSCHIGPGAVIRNSILMPGCTVGREAQLDFVICDKRVRIADFVTMAGTAQEPFAIGKEEYAALKF